MSRKIAFFLVLFIFTLALSWAKSFEARQLIDHLYMVPGQMPINDLIIEMEASERNPEKGGKSAMLEPTGRDKIFFKKPNRLRIDSILVDPGGPLDGKSTTIIRDGVNVWQYVAMGQYPVKKKADEPSAPLMIPFNIMTYSQDRENRCVLVGKEMIENVSTDVLRIVNPSKTDESITVWIDSQRRVPLKFEKKIEGRGEKGSTVVKQVIYKDIRKLPDGRFFPFLLEVYQNKDLRKVLVYKKVAVNVGLQDSLFEPMSKFIK